jgi:hypothetical protein
MGVTRTWLLSIIGVAPLGFGALNACSHETNPADERASTEGAGVSRNAKYAFATNGIVEAPGIKLLLDEKNLGGKELEVAELTLPAGTVDGAHQHGSEL